MAFSTHDQVPDSPTNVFAVLNSLNKITVNGAISISNGNLYVAYEASANGASFAVSSIKSGLWYFEATKTSGTYYGVGLHDGTMNNSYINTISWNDTSNGIIGILADMNTNTIYSYVNGSIVSSETASIPNDLRYFSIGVWSSGGVGRGKCFANFGQDPTFGGNKSPSSTYTDANGIGSFYYQPPTGAKALCTANLADPDIDPAVDDLPEDYMKSVTYSGGSQSITVGFRPDLVWIKNRGSTFSHILSDSVRGDGKFLTTNGSGAEESDSSKFNQFESNGFSVGSHSGVSSSSQIAWCFRAGGSPSGSTSTTGSAKRINTSGTQDDTSCSALATAASATITPTLMSINQKAGFSIIKYGGSSASSSTVPHGLGKAPEMIIIKNLDSSDQWVVYHKSVASDAETDYLVLDTTAAAVDNATVWNDTAPTTQVFSIGQGGSVSESNENYIAYCWHSVAGFSAFGSYTGNGSADGPFVYTGFKPALIWIKCTSDSTITHTSWSIYDNAREPNNEMNKPLYANQSAPEGERGNGTTDATDIKIDFLSNGFRILTDKEELNDDGETYIFCCWAEMPSKYAATNAR